MPCMHWHITSFVSKMCRLESYTWATHSLGCLTSCGKHKNHHPTNQLQYTHSRCLLSRWSVCWQSSQCVACSGQTTDCIVLTKVQRQYHALVWIAVRRAPQSSSRISLHDRSAKHLMEHIDRTTGSFCLCLHWAILHRKMRYRPTPLATQNAIQNKSQVVFQKHSISLQMAMDYKCSCPFVHSVI